MDDRDVLTGAEDGAQESAVSASVPKWHVSVGFLTDTGRVRERNEDSFAVHLPYAGEASRAPADAFFAVADGMGGHQAGDFASQFVSGATQQAFAEREEQISDISAWLERLIRRVNRELASVARRQAAARGMGSTLTIAVLQSGKLYLGHVGDSRCYRLFGGDLEQLTPDHSWVGEQVRAGQLSPQEAEKHPKRNLLTQCLGVDSDVKPYLAEEKLHDGSRYLLCSDGLFGGVPHAVLRRVLLDERDPQAAARRLISIANEAGGGDNITAIVFDITKASDLAVTSPGQPSLPVSLQEAAGSLGDTRVDQARPDASPSGRSGPTRDGAGPLLPGLAGLVRPGTPLVPRLLLAAGVLLVLIGTGMAARGILLARSTDTGPEGPTPTNATPGVTDEGADGAGESTRFTGESEDGPAEPDGSADAATPGSPAGEGPPAGETAPPPGEPPPLPEEAAPPAGEGAGGTARGPSHPQMSPPAPFRRE